MRSPRFACDEHPIDSHWLPLVPGASKAALPGRMRRTSEQCSALTRATSAEATQTIHSGFAHRTAGPRLCRRFPLTRSHLRVPTYAFPLTRSHLPVPTHPFPLTRSHLRVPTHPFPLTRSHSPVPACVCVCKCVCVSVCVCARAQARAFLVRCSDLDIPDWIETDEDVSITSHTAPLRSAQLSPCPYLRRSTHAPAHAHDAAGDARA